MDVRTQAAIERPGHTVGAVLSATRILRYLGSVSEPVRLVHIVKELALNKSTCLNILRTLTDAGLVAHNPTAKTYALGFGILELARGALMGLEERTAVQPMLDAFSRRHALSVILWRREEQELVVIANSTVGAAVQIKALIGTRVPLLTGSMGRIVAAKCGLDNTTLRARFAEVHGGSLLNFEDFVEEASLVQSQGWAGDSAEVTNIRSGLSAAVESERQVDRIVSLVLIPHQFTPEQLPALGQDLAELGHRIGASTASQS